MSCGPVPVSNCGLWTHGASASAQPGIPTSGGYASWYGSPYHSTRPLLNPEYRLPGGMPPSSVHRTAVHRPLLSPEYRLLGGYATQYGPPYYGTSAPAQPGISTSGGYAARYGPPYYGTAAPVQPGLPAFGGGVRHPVRSSVLRYLGPCSARNTDFRGVCRSVRSSGPRYLGLCSARNFSFRRASRSFPSTGLSYAWRHPGSGCGRPGVSVPYAFLGPWVPAPVPGPVWSRFPGFRLAYGLVGSFRHQLPLSPLG